MARVGGTNLSELLPLVVQQLKDELELKDSTCFVSLNPQLHPSPTPGSIWLTVTPGGGAFDPAQWDGGGTEMATCDTTFTVTVHSPVKLDERGRDGTFLNHATLGVLKILDQVLKALSAFDPADTGGDLILREQLQPNGWSEPERHEATLGSVGVVFTAKFDWDLSS